MESGITGQLDDLVARHLPKGIQGSYSPWVFLIVALLLPDKALPQPSDEPFAGTSIGVKGGIPFPTYGLFVLFEVDSEKRTFLMISIDSYPNITSDRATILSIHVSSNYQLSPALNLRPYIGLGDYLILGNGFGLFNFAIHVGGSLEAMISPASIFLFSIEKSIWFSNPKVPPVSLAIGLRFLL